MANRKLCPMSMAQTQAPSQCAKEYCAWYINGDCSINHIAHSKAKAEEETQTPATPLSHISLIEFKEHVGPYTTEKVVLYNENNITEAEALRIVKADEYNENVLCLPKKQWLALFKNQQV